MSLLHSRTGRASRTLPWLLAVLGVMLPETMASAGPREDRYRDMETCAQFGARYGSPQYTDCMLSQQRRRDLRKLEKSERAANLSQIARDSQIMSEQVHRQRCRRKPDSRLCR